MAEAILGALGRALRLIAPRLPLGLRKRLAVLAGRLPGRASELCILALLDDWGAADPAAYHRFIWGRHLLFAKYYDFREIEHSRGRYFERLHPLRRELLETVAACLREQGVAPEDGVRSMLDVGCSLGYLLRNAETAFFPGATRLLGVDIDEFAIAEGAAHLRGVGSAVELRVADLGMLAGWAGREAFDVVTCTGVLHYLEEDEARAAVATMLGLTTRLLALSGPACEEMDNALLERSLPRAFYRDDLSLVHNFDRMVADAGGRVVARRWGGGEVVEGRRGAYIVVAAPAA